MKRGDNTLEKLGLLILAGMAIVTLAVISFKALARDSVDPNAATMIGVVITGLIAFGKDIIQALRGYAMSAQLGKVTDQLAASGPAAPLPDDAAEAARQTAEAAQDKADQIGALNPPTQGSSADLRDRRP